jgi:hypothetical protein
MLCPKYGERLAALIAVEGWEELVGCLKDVW